MGAPMRNPTWIIYNHFTVQIILTATKKNIYIFIGDQNQISTKMSKQSYYIIRK